MRMPNVSRAISRVSLRRSVSLSASALSAISPESARPSSRPVSLCTTVSASYGYGRPIAASDSSAALVCASSVPAVDASCAIAVTCTLPTLRLRVLTPASSAKLASRAPRICAAVSPSTQTV